MKKILITGSTGFIGSTLIKFFLYKNYEVFALTRKKNKSSLIKYIKADIFDHKRINKVFKKIKPNYLIHLAWEASPNKYQNSKANYKWLHSSLNLYLNFCKYGGSKALITGSCAEYDFNNYLLKEKLIKKNDYTRYSLCKETFLHHALKISLIFNTKLVWARLFWIYGINQKKGRLIPDLINAAKNNKKILIRNPNSFINLLNVYDVSVALFKTFESKITGIINIADKKNVKVIDIANQCKKIFIGCNISYKKQNKKYSKPFSAKIEKLNLLKFKKFYTLEKGLKTFL